MTFEESLQHVIRDYCERTGYVYDESAAEGAIENLSDFGDDLTDEVVTNEYLFFHRIDTLTDLLQTFYPQYEDVYHLTADATTFDFDQFKDDTFTHFEGTFTNDAGDIMIHSIWKQG